MTEQALASLAESLKTLVDLQSKTPKSTRQDLTGNSSHQGQSHFNCSIFDSFDETKEKFSTYKCRLENYFDLRGIKDDQVACAKMLLHCIGPVHFETLASYTAPEPPTKFEYKKLIKLLEDHVMPAPNVIVEQHRFLNRLQKAEENITTYVSELRKFIQTCKFNCGKCKESVADIFLRAQFVRGIKNSSIREKLLQEDDPDFNTIIQKAASLEASQLDNTEMSKPANVEKRETVNKVRENRFNNRGQLFNNNREFRGRSRSVNRPQFRGNRDRSFSRGRSQSRNRVNYHELDVADLCLRCGRNDHRIKQCRVARDRLKCDSCSKIGHVAKVCIFSLSKRKSSQNNRSSNFNDSNCENSSMNYVSDSLYPSHSHSDSYFRSQINHITSVSTVALNSSHLVIPDNEKIYATIRVNGRLQIFETDSGSKNALISRSEFNRLNLNCRIEPPDTSLDSYTGDGIRILGKVVVSISHGREAADGMSLYIVEDGRATVLGRDWIRALKLNVLELDQVRRTNVGNFSSCVHSVSVPQVGKDIAEIETRFAERFQKIVGKMPTDELKGILRLRPNARPIFIKARTVPYALREKADEELDTLEREGVITQISHSDWGAPLVIVVKPNGSLRLCVDYKIGVNPQIEDAHYPIPKIDEILNELRDSKYFCVLDLYKAYLHIPVDEETAKIQTISTHKGTYRVNRLSMGIKSAPSEFHRILNQILREVEGTVMYFDDIIIFAKEYGECKKRLISCLERLEKFNLHVNREKCKFFEQRIEYLGHVISQNQIAKSPKKIEAIAECPRPKSPEEVKGFLGLITYYSRFIPEASSVTYPLRQLLQKERRFFWSTQCEAAFQKLKNEIASDRVLMPFNPALPVTLACDASPIGIGAVLSHKVDGMERPVAFASRSLTQAEQNYSQLDREALAIYWALHKFYEYVFARKFTLITDNRPLYHIFNENSKLPAMTSARLLRYAAFLTAFEYTVKHRKSEENANADFLSRAPLKRNDEESDSAESDAVYIETVNQISSTAVNFRILAKETQEDTELKKLKEELLNGKNVNPEYSLQNGVIFRGSRVVIPKKLQKEVLQELHHTHLGVTKMKALARRYCQWPGIDRDIESLVKACCECASVKGNPPKAELHHWEPPKQNFQRIHMDYAGPMDGYYFLIVVDAKSKWPEVRCIKSAPSSASTIRLLYDIFVSHGFPEVLVSDNATIFKSEEFTTFCAANGIKQKFIAPGHPATNGLAERYVQILKNKLKAMVNVEAPIEQKVQEIVFRFRATPLIDGKSPAELYLNRKFRIRLDALMPHKEETPSRGSARARQISVGERVQSRYYGSGENWKMGVVEKKLGRLHYIVRLDDGYTIKRHINQLRVSEVPLQGAQPARQERRVTFAPETGPTRHYRPPLPLTGPPRPNPPCTAAHRPQQVNVASPLRRSGRERHTPEFLGPVVDSSRLRFR